MSGRQPGILQVKDVSKSFDRTQVLANIDLEAPRGSIVALLGASGSGKTTLLQLIAGLQEPDSGSLIIDGRDMRGVPAFDRPVNMMFQSYALFPHLTVSGNIAYGLKARGVARVERDRLVAWALDLTRLEGLADRRPDQLSGGQRQRVALARCLVMKPAILLLDEPMAALDRGLRADVQRELTAIQREVGTTFVLVTHDQEEAMAMADYIAVMQKGRIAQFGTPRELYERPGSRFVASFLGNVNLFEGKAAGLAAGSLRFTSEERLEFSIADAGTIAAADVVAAGWRPESLIVSRHETTQPNDFAGTVDRISYGGGQSTASIRLAGGQLLTAMLLNGQSGADTRLAAGDPVHVGLPPHAGMVFTQ